MAEVILVVPDDLKMEIEAVSKREHRPEADIIRDALRQYVDQLDEIAWPRSIGMVSDGSFNAADAEKYLAERWKRD